MKYRLLFSFAPASAIVFFGLAGCSTEPPAQPMCRVDSHLTQEISSSAACIIRINNSLVVIKRKISGKFDIPGGNSQKLENSQCTAHRNTWEQTGFNVLVKEHLVTTKQGVDLFKCELDAGFTGEISQFPVPAWSRSQVRGIYLKDPFDLRKQSWLQNGDLIEVRNQFNRAAELESATPSDQAPAASTPEPDDAID